MLAFDGVMAQQESVYLGGFDCELTKITESCQTV